MTDGEIRRGTQAYGSAVRTALRNNATAYGFSIAITAAFSLATTAAGGRADVIPTFLFAVGAVFAFIVVGAGLSRYSHSGGREDSGEVVLVSGAVDLLSVLAAIGSAALLALVPGLVLWPLVGFGATTMFLLVNGLDVLIARWVVRRR